MSDDKSIKDLVEQVVISLVDDPESVTAEEVEEGNTLIINVRVNPDDIGKIIGRQGRVIKSLRTIARAASSYSGGKHIEVEILD
ncbi:MAG: KH domain-containing protein [Coriobacteriia bacterium]|nr:KH domain-containing protein [Coriobacteriia bacterium]MCL2750810.1 KH domain-containing protein [Coriobacteriia bacterium]